MERILHYNITAEPDIPIAPHSSATQWTFTVQHFLKSRGFSAKSIIQLKKSPDFVLLNGKPARMKDPLSPGDVLTLLISEEKSSEKIPPVKLPLDILYEDEDIMVLNKPADMPIHPSMNNYYNSLANALAWYFEDQGKPFVFRCINRLDRDTSGLTLIAKHYVSAGILSNSANAVTPRTPHSNGKNRQILTPCQNIPKEYQGTLKKYQHIQKEYRSIQKEYRSIQKEYRGIQKEYRGIQKEYLAIVRGSVTPASGTIDAPLCRKPGSVLEREVDFEHGERAVTHYRVVKEENGHSLISLTLETGRTHQIRVHMKYIGFPLIGDYLYNPDTEWIGRQALHCCRLSFPHPITGRDMEFTSPLPDDMANIISL